MGIFASDELYPDVVVDGLASNHGKTVFEYTVQPVEILQGKIDEYFVEFCMETKQARDLPMLMQKRISEKISLCCETISIENITIFFLKENLYDNHTQQ